MILDGRSIIDKHYVTFDPDALVDTDSQVQPNGIDLRVARIYEVHGKVHVPMEGKVKHDLQIVEQNIKDNTFSLNRDVMYYVDFLEKVSVPEAACAMLITRSSLVRSGVDVVSGLWDSGFYGQLGCCLRVHNPIEIQWGAKLCQIVFMRAKFNGQLYSGRYLGSNSQTAVQDT